MKSSEGEMDAGCEGSMCFWQRWIHKARSCETMSVNHQEGHGVVTVCCVRTNTVQGQATRWSVCSKKKKETKWKTICLGLKWETFKPVKLEKCRKAKCSPFFHKSIFPVNPFLIRISYASSFSIFFFFFCVPITYGQVNRFVWLFFHVSNKCVKTYLLTYLFVYCGWTLLTDPQWVRQPLHVLSFTLLMWRRPALQKYTQCFCGKNSRYVFHRKSP